MIRVSLELHLTDPVKWSSNFILFLLNFDNRIHGFDTRFFLCYVGLSVF